MNRPSATCARARRLVVPTLLVTTLAACGGGGGGSGASTAAIDLTASNQDNVAHAAAVSFLALGPASAIPLSSGSQSAAASSRMLPREMLSVARRTSALATWRSTAGGRKTATQANRPLATIGPFVDNCLVSGSSTLVIDDRDGNGYVSVGDVFTFTFAACADDATETLDGTVTLSIASVGSGTLPPFSGRMTFIHLADEAVDHGHGTVLDGSADLSYAQTNPTTETLAFTVPNTLASTVHAPALGSDTVTLLQGFGLTVIVDSSTPPPADAGSSTYGSSTTTLSGKVDSSSAGGWFTVSSAGTPIVAYDADAYPRSGGLRASGAQGVVALTVLSPDQIRIDLDANDDGTMESTQTQAWDWLF